MKYFYLAICSVVLVLLLFVLFSQNQVYIKPQSIQEAQQKTFALDFPAKIIVHETTIQLTCEHYQWSLQDNDVELQNCYVHVDDAQKFWREFVVYLPIVMK